jgi:ribA/ribD-fused uncharacterized protein
LSNLYRCEVAAAPTPSLCALAGHALFRYHVRSDWSHIKVARMRQVLRAKFDQNPKLAAMLTDTGDANLIEDSSTDAFWGIGRRGTGRNILGNLLMETRELIAGDCSSSGLAASARV